MAPDLRRQTVAERGAGNLGGDAVPEPPADDGFNSASSGSRPPLAGETRPRPTPAGNRRNLWIDLTLLALLILGGWCYTSGADKAADIALSDESAYLYYGLVDEPVGGQRSAAFAPLYIAWYRTLSWIEPDTVDLYYLNQRLMTVLPALALFVLLRASSVSPLVAIAAAWLWLIGGTNFPTGPKVSHFALTILLFGLSVSLLFRRIETRVAACGVAALLASFARPELFLAHLGLQVLAVGLLVWRGHFRQAGPPVLAGVVVSLILISVVGKPLDPDRSIRAFQQHFALNYVAWEGSTTNPWTEGASIFESHFGDAETVPAAAWANPTTFAWHVLRNARQFGPQVSAKVFSTYPYQLSVPLILLLLLSFSAAFGLWPRVPAALILRENISAVGWSVALIGILVLPTIVASLVIYPRFHYLLIAEALVLAAGLMLLFRRKPEAPAKSSHLAAVCVACLLLVMQVPLSASPRPHQPNLATIRFLRSLDVTQPTGLLAETGGVYAVYIGDRVDTVPAVLREDNESLDQFLDRMSVGMIVASRRTPGNSRFKGDSDWAKLLAKPANRQFVALPVPGVNGRLVLVKRHLLPAAAVDEPAGHPATQPDVGPVAGRGTLRR